jgi:hypothetical protein
MVLMIRHEYGLQCGWKQCVSYLVGGSTKSEEDFQVSIDGRFCVSTEAVCTKSRCGAIPPSCSWHTVDNDRRKRGRPFRVVRLIHQSTTSQAPTTSTIGTRYK